MLFQVKFEVQALEKHLKALNAQIYGNQQVIHVLTAEWSHLNDPTRLTELNARYLQLAPVEARQMARLEDLPPRMTAPSGSEVGLEALQVMAPAAGPSLPKLAPVTRSAPLPVAAEKPAATPTVAGSILETIAGLVGIEEGKAE
jgi:hypothetical protein